MVASTIPKSRFYLGNEDAFRIMDQIRIRLDVEMTGRIGALKKALSVRFVLMNSGYLIPNLCLVVSRSFWNSAKAA
jgi:hypothetical protein